MSIAVHALAEAPIAADRQESSPSKPPPSRVAVAKSDATHAPEAR
ncbi:MAG TPA: hypothetical protein VM265_06155 [Sphingomicrobium sp.]|nr:hypothetical protein [Sphingomicrobium sp.]